MTENTQERLGLTAQVVAAYVAHNSLPQPELIGLIERTHAALSGLGEDPVPPPVEKPVAAVSVKKSITADWIICREDGKKFKSLKRHRLAELARSFDASCLSHPWGIRQENA